MTKLLKQAFAAASRLSPEAQDDIARAVLHLATGEDDPEATDPGHLPAILEALEQLGNKTFVTDEEVEAALRRFDR